VGQARAAIPTEMSAAGSKENEQAKTLEEGLAEAQKWDGDPLDCPCIQHMKEGPCGADFVVAYDPALAHQGLTRDLNPWRHAPVFWDISYTFQKFVGEGL
jgi:hypothetical protein